MRFAKRWTLGAMIACALAGPAAAQFAPTLDEKSTVVEALVVRGYGGPPWWKVSDADTTVYVLATPGALPAGVSVDTRLLEKRMQGANELILTPRISDNRFSTGLPPAGVRLMKAMNKEARAGMEAGLPEPIRRRFVAQREAAGQAESRYGALPPGLAAAALVGDLNQARAQSGQTPAPGQDFERIVWQAAKTAKVQRIMPARVYGQAEVKGLYDDAWKLDMSCMTSTLDALEAPPPRSRAQTDDILKAWADGDIRPLLGIIRANGHSTQVAISRSTPAGSFSLRIARPQCLGQIPTFGRLSREWIPAEVDALVRALAKPGHAVALYDAPSLVVTGGVLAQLQQRGFKVTGPDDAGD